ncbi:Lysozyme, partial [Gryllus bimaculatus]
MSHGYKGRASALCQHSPPASPSAITMMHWLGLLALLGAVGGKVYENCEFAKELRDIYEFPTDQISTWVCIADLASWLRTRNVRYPNDSPSELGIFGISEGKCLSEKKNGPPKPGQICNVTCDKLLDDDIADDAECAKQIYAENMRKKGNGFASWDAYR